MQTWVSLERIQFVGACNPPTDPGRKPLAHRFLRHVPVIYVDYPGEASLKQIYGTFNRAMLKLIPPLRTYAGPLTNAMVDFFLMSRDRFTQDMQPHYVYSPREMTRWVRGICEAVRPLECWLASAGCAERKQFLEDLTDAASAAAEQLMGAGAGHFVAEVI